MPRPVRGKRWLLVTLWVVLAAAAPTFGQGSPVQDTHHYVGPLEASAVTSLSTCPLPVTSGQECTDTFVIVFQHREGASSTTRMGFVQRTYIVDGGFFESAAVGSGPATLSIKPPLLAAEITADLDLTVCDSDLECVTAPAVVSGHWTATSELMEGALELVGDGATMRVFTGLSLSRNATANVSLNGVAVPGVDVDALLGFPSTKIFRARHVNLCMSVYSGGC